MRIDTVLGVVRLCPGCEEEWPFDDAFWHMRDGHLSPAWPGRCRACCVEYTAERKRVAMEIARGDRFIPDPIEGKCNALMRGGRCGRKPGHQWQHRTTTTMADESARHARAS